MLLLCSRCVKAVIFNAFKTGTNAVPFLPVLSCVLGVFNNPVVTPVHGLLGLTRVFDYDIYWRTRACFVYLCHSSRFHYVF